MENKNPYYDLIKKSCQNYNDDDKKQWIANGTMFSDWDEPYEIIREHLQMSVEEFEDYQVKKSDSFDDDYNTFIDAEQMILKEFTNEFDNVKNDEHDVGFMIRNIIIGSIFLCLLMVVFRLIS